MTEAALGRIVILNGAPRSGKSSIVVAIQDRFDGVWINVGVDVAVRHMTPARYRPGIGLRPGGERPDLEPQIPPLYAALYDSIAAHSQQGLNVVADFGHHDSYATIGGILPDCARRLSGLPVLFVGVHCPIETILARRAIPQAGREGMYLTADGDGGIPDAVLRWQTAVHDPGIYDLEVDTSVLSPEACADAIRSCLDQGIRPPTAFERLAEIG